MAFVESLTPFFADFGADATIAGTAARGILDTASEVALGEAIVVAPSLLVPASTAAAAGDAVAVGGAAYKVRQVLDEPPDGALRRLVLAKV